MDPLGSLLANYTDSEDEDQRSSSFGATTDANKTSASFAFGTGSSTPATVVSNTSTGTSPVGSGASMFGAAPGFGSTFGTSTTAVSNASTGTSKPFPIGLGASYGPIGSSAFGSTPINPW